MQYAILRIVNDTHTQAYVGINSNAYAQFRIVYNAAPTEELIAKLTSESTSQEVIDWLCELCLDLDSKRYVFDGLKSEIELCLPFILAMHLDLEVETPLVDMLLNFTAWMLARSELNYPEKGRQLSHMWHILYCDLLKYLRNQNEVKASFQEKFVKALMMLKKQIIGPFKKLALE